MFKSKVLIIAVFLLAFILRFWGLGVVPSGFDADEAAFGYNSYSLLKTGKDEYGKVLPLSLKSFGEYKPALYSYFTIPFIQTFDLNPFSARTASALFGFLTVVLFYFFVLKVSANKKVALFSSLVLATSPWHINLSRTVSEVILALFFNILLLYSLFLFREVRNKKWLIIAIVAALLSILSYTASRFFTPLLILLFFILLRNKENLKEFIRPYRLLIFLILGAVVFYTFIDSANRIKQISVFETPQTRLVLEEQIRENRNTPVTVTRAFHNKVVNYSRTIAENYAKYFTFDFLFLNGGLPQRMKIPDSGLFYFWQLPFILFGIYLVFKKRDQIGLFMTAWWLLSLIPVSMTFDEVPNVYRSAISLPPILYICALGFVGFYSNLSTIKKALLVFIVIISVWEISYYELQYLRQDVHRPWYRGYAYKELVQDINKDYEKYDKFIITKAHSSPYIYLLFYSKYDPKKYQAMGSPRDIVAYGGFDKYLFSEHDCPSFSFPRKKLGKDGTFLFVDNGNCADHTDSYIKDPVKLIKVIYWKDNTKALKLLEYKPL